MKMINALNIEQRGCDSSDDGHAGDEATVNASEATKALKAVKATKAGGEGEETKAVNATKASELVCKDCGTIWMINNTQFYFCTACEKHLPMP